MKKIFTLIAMACMAMSVNAQELSDKIYYTKSITWGDITWKIGNVKKDNENKEMPFVMGTGNGYENIYAEEFYSENQGADMVRAFYTYIDYEGGKTGLPGYGLYYKFTPSKDGALKINVWVNKGNRKTFIVKASDGKPLTPYVDYTFEGYVNGQNSNTTIPQIDESTGAQKLDNDGNPVWVQAPTFFTADQIKTRHDEYSEQQVTGGKNPVSPYVIDAGNQAVWGWIVLNVKANETYCLYQQSSQLGFGGFEFDGQVYDATPEGALSAEFKAVVDGDGKATNVTDKGSVVTFEACGVKVEACGGAVPTEVEADKERGPVNQGTGIATIAAEQKNAPIFNLAGQRVARGVKGLMIQNGKKFLVK